MDKIITEKATHTLMGSNIIVTEPKPNVTWDAEDLYVIHKAHLQLTNNKPFGLILNATHFLLTTKEARELVATNVFIEHHKASAFVTTNFSNRLVGNIFIRINKPPVPTKIFKDVESAIKWLEKLKI